MIKKLFVSLNRRPPIDRNRDKDKEKDKLPAIELTNW